MLLTVKNLGPIREGTIDLSKKFYVFVGYNNSGKTYMAHLLWTIFYALTDRAINAFIDTLDLRDIEVALQIDKYMLLEANGERQGVEITLDLVNVVLSSFAEKIQTELFPESMNVDRTHALLENFAVGFRCDADAYRKKVFAAFYETEEIITPLGETFYLTLTKEEESTIVTLTLTPGKEFEHTVETCLDYIDDAELVAACVKFLFGLLFDRTIPFYLPADRTFYPTWYKYIYGKERDAFKRSKKPETTQEIIRLFSQYTQPKDALVEAIYHLNLTHPQHTQFYQDLVGLLQHILGGEILFKSPQIEGFSALGDFFLKMASTTELEMYLSSSSVNQLTCLYLFLQYWAQGNHLLVLDEPEENLHPAHQLKLLDLLIKFANRHNNKVLITTHSPLLTEAINNHLNLGILKNNGVNLERLIETHRIDIDPEAVLRSEDIGIYFFDGEHIHEYATGTYGTLFADFNAVERHISDIHEILTDEIYYLTHQDTNNATAHIA